VDILSNFSEFDDERLAEYLGEVREAFNGIAGLETPTDAQLDEAESYADHIEAIVVEQQTRVSAAEQRAERAASLRSRFAEDSEQPPEEPPEEPGSGEDEDEEPEDDKNTTASDKVAAAVTTTRARGVVATLAKKVARPETPKPEKRKVTITAAADVPEFATGSPIDDLTSLGQATLNRMRGFPTPNGDADPDNVDFHMYGVGMLGLDFEDDLQITRSTADDMEVLYHAIDESRLPSGSLVAAGGWCAPSETLYDLCAGETTEGMVSVPEVQVKRGGIRYTTGVDFGTIYSNVGFCQTETQAIAGTTKPCFEVPCPTFQEVRLDVCGLCIRIPILTSVGYPELIQRWMSGSLIAHQHKMNARVIAAMATAAGAALVPTGIGTTAGDIRAGLGIIADGLRAKYRLGMSASFEAVVPFWVKGAIKADLALRTGLDDPTGISDSDVQGLFSAIGLNVQFVYDWQPLGANAVAYPTTFQALVYPAGTFVKGVSDVINLSAVYDAASLATNTYTGLFFEEGILVAKMCYEAALVTLPVCNAGRTGAANLSCP
jgi:hypothetical protein